MQNTILNTEPEAFTAGDTVQWLKSLSDYPADDGWVLNYVFINAANKYSISSTAQGASHKINITAATSAAYVAGLYSTQSFVTNGEERYTVATGNIQINPNLAGQAFGFDTRSPAKKCLDQLDAALSTYGKKAYLQQYSIAGRSMSFNNPSEFLAFRSKVQQEVNREISAQRIKNGMSARNKTTIGF
jgi:hypothetical protein